MKMEIKNECYEYVKMSLDTYNTLKYQDMQILRNLESKQEYNTMLEDKITELTCQLEIFKEEILNKYLLDYRVRDYKLEDVTDIGEWNYGLDNSQYLLKIGFTIDEMNEFITKKWNEFHQPKEEEENE